MNLALLIFSTALAALGLAFGALALYRARLTQDDKFIKQYRSQGLHIVRHPYQGEHVRIIKTVYDQDEEPLFSPPRREEEHR